MYNCTFGDIWRECGPYPKTPPGSCEVGLYPRCLSVDMCYRITA